MNRLVDEGRAAVMAYRCLVKLGVDVLPVRPLEILRRCRNTVTYTFQRAAEELDMTEADFERCCGTADAFTFRQGERYVVCYRAGGNPARLNFTLAHELGHILLRHTDTGAADEAEANCFASHLLCPEPVLHGKTAEEIATTCYVSKSAAAMALERKKCVLSDELAEKVHQLFANNHVE